VSNERVGEDQTIAGIRERIWGFELAGRAVTVLDQGWGDIEG